MKKYLLTLLSVLLSTGCLLTSCSKDDDEQPSKPGTENVTPSDPNAGNVTQSNPLVGKTIKCVENDKHDFMRFTTNFSIQFISATIYIQTLKQTVEELDWATGKWYTSFNLDKTVNGTYEYSSSRIVLHPSDGGSSTLTKESNGWKDGNYLYK